MSRRHRIALVAAAAASLLGSAATPALALDNGFVGLNVGRPDYRLDCGTLGGCSDPSVRWHLRAGAGLWGRFGGEIGWVDEGRFSRAGGDTRAEGLVLAGFARVPFGRFSGHARLGAVYGRTNVSAAPLSGVTAGSRTGWGPSYAVGGGFDLTPTSTVLVEWNRNEYPFPGGGREPVASWNLGFEQRF